MIDLDAMAADLIADERLVLVVYDDATGRPIGPGSLVRGHPTVGVGRALDLKGISSQEAQDMLANDILEYVRDLMPMTWFAKLDPIRQRAIVNMRHQLGLGGLLGFKIMIAALVRKDWIKAAGAAADSDWAKWQTSERAARIIFMLEKGIDPRRPAGQVNGPGV